MEAQCGHCTAWSFERRFTGLRGVLGACACHESVIRKMSILPSGRHLLYSLSQASIDVPFIASVEFEAGGKTHGTNECHYLSFIMYRYEISNNIIN